MLNCLSTGAGNLRSSWRSDQHSDWGAGPHNQVFGRASGPPVNVVSRDFEIDLYCRLISVDIHFSCISSVILVLMYMIVYYRYVLVSILKYINTSI